MQEDVEEAEYDHADGTDKWLQRDRCLKWHHQYCTVVLLLDGVKQTFSHLIDVLLLIILYAGFRYSVIFIAIKMFK